MLPGRHGAEEGPAEEEGNCAVLMEGKRIAAGGEEFPVKLDLEGPGADNAGKVGAEAEGGSRESTVFGDTGVRGGDGDVGEVPGLGLHGGSRDEEIIGSGLLRLRRRGCRGFRHRGGGRRSNRDEDPVGDQPERRGDGDGLAEGILKIIIVGIQPAAQRVAGVGKGYIRLCEVVGSRAAVSYFGGCVCTRFKREG